MPKRASRQKPPDFRAAAASIPIRLASRANRKQFLAEKAFWLADLGRALRIPNRARYSVSPVLRNCLIKLAKLQFAFSWDYNWALYSTPSGRRDYLRSPPKGRKYFIYRAPFITVRLDGSRRSMLFWRRIAELCRQYPHAVAETPSARGNFDIMPSVGRGGVEERISSGSLGRKQARATRFFLGLEKIIDEFL